MLLRTLNTFLTVMLWLLCSLWLGCRFGDSEPSITRMEDLPVLPSAPSQRDLPRGASAEVRDLTVALVGEVRGELEPCGCPTLPFGGFERRSTQLEKLKATALGPVFHVDAGDTLVKGFSTKRIDKLETRAAEILRLSQLVGVDVWVPGSSDLLAFSPDELLAVTGPKRISATWIKPNGEPLLPRSIVLDRDGIRLGVVGISGPPPNDSGLTFLDPIAATQVALKDLPPDLDWVVAASNLDENKVASFAQDVKGLSAILSTRGKQYDSPTLSTEQTPVIETPDRGRYLQVIHARLGSEPSSPLLLHPEAATWRARLASSRRGEADKLQEDGAGRNLGLVNTIPLSADLDSPGEISDRLVRYKADRRDEAAKNAAKTEPHTQAYASSGACVNCHSGEFARWALTGHAQAWLALVERQETENPECIGCHTTAYGEPGGLGELTRSNIRKFKGVQCEMCHGPLAGHPSDPDVSARPVQESDCIVCHDEANSPKFEFEQYLAQASCQGGSPSIIPKPPEP